MSTESASALAEPKKEINGKHLEKIDLRVARIVAARHVEGADRLLQLTLDVGGLASPPPSTDGGGSKQGGAAAPSDASQPVANGTAGYRTVFSGIKAAYKPEELVGRLVIYVANLKAWKTPFGLSEGMILAASDPSGSQIFLSATDPGAQPGMIVT